MKAGRPFSLDVRRTITRWRARTVPIGSELLCSENYNFPVCGNLVGLCHVASLLSISFSAMEKHLHDGCCFVFSHILALAHAAFRVNDKRPTKKKTVIKDETVPN